MTRESVDPRGRGLDLRERVFAGGGEMGALMRSFDWSKTPVGSVDSWPQSLRTSVSILLESKFGMMIAWGPELAHFYNDAFRPILGSTKHPTLGASVPEVFRESWDAVIGPLFGTVLAGEAVRFDDLMVPLDRHGYLEECFFTFSYSPLRDESGSVGGVQVIAVETTARVLAERRLELLRDLAECASQSRSEAGAWRRVGELLEGESSTKEFAFSILYSVASDGVTATRVHASGGEGDGRAGDGRVGDRGVGEGGEGQGRAPVSSPWPFESAVAEKEPVLVANIRERFGDVPGPVWPEPIEEALLLPIRRPGGTTPYGVLAVGLSPRRRFDESYRDFAVLVAEHVATAIANARTHEEERRRADALAELDRQKTAFLGNISHEFRTPLTLMLGPTEDLLCGVHGELAEAQRAQLELVRRNQLRLQRLVNALLEFSRLEAGRAQASYQRSDIAKRTREIASSFHAVANRAGLEFVVDCSPIDAEVFVDDGMWEQIVLNLVSNAFKFTFEGRIEVSLRLEAEGVVLRVRDTGVGVKAEDVPRLFERFHRVEGTRARTHEGSGIGLALVQELARLHGGHVAVRSEYSVGSSFAVTIPVGSAHLPRERVPRLVSEPDAPSVAAFVEEAYRWLPAFAPEIEIAPPTWRDARSGDPQKPRVLVVDDNADMREYLRRLLEASYSVAVVEDGAAALEAARASLPDVVLTDVMMPSLDGFGLVRALRAEPRTRGVPVILVSARAGDDARVEGLQAGADDYVAKPFSGRELLARVAMHASAHRRRQSLEAERASLRLLFDEAPAFICMLKGEEHVFQLVNRMYSALIGGREALGMTVREALPEVAGQGYFDLLDEVYRTGKPYFGNEDRIMLDRAGDGQLEERFLNFIYSPSRDEEGNIDGVLVFGFDVTEQRRARRRLEEARMTADAAHAKAESAIRAREEFLTVASHELRTPLTTLGLQLDGLVRSLRQSGVEPTPKRWLDKAERLREQADRLEALIEGMFEVFSLSRERIELRYEDVDLATIARHAVERLRSASKQSPARFELVTESVTGRWDPTRLEQILTQLLSNALKFGAGKAISVRVESRGGAARLSVVDRGIGIASEHHSRIFERFERATSASHYAGFGLGLWIVRELVTAMHGTVRVESDPGRGSTFIVDLPRSA